MKFLSVVDLRIRWNYSKAGVHKLISRPDFPKPFTTVSQGKIKLFIEADIEAYERDKPWLFDKDLKIRRQRLFSLLNQAKQNPAQQENILKHAFGDRAKKWT